VGAWREAHPDAPGAATTVAEAPLPAELRGRPDLRPGARPELRPDGRPVFKPFAAPGQLPRTLDEARATAAGDAKAAPKLRVLPAPQVEVTR